MWRCAFWHYQIAVRAVGKFLFQLGHAAFDFVPELAPLLGVHAVLAHHAHNLWCGEKGEVDGWGEIKICDTMSVY